MSLKTNLQIDQPSVSRIETNSAEGPDRMNIGRMKYYLDLDRLFITRLSSEDGHLIGFFHGSHRFNMQVKFGFYGVHLNCGCSTATAYSTSQEGDGSVE